MTTPTSSYAIAERIAGTVVERTPRGAEDPSGWMVRCACGYKAGPYAAGLVTVANQVRDKHETQCKWPRT